MNPVANPSSAHRHFTEPDGRRRRRAAAVAALDDSARIARLYSRNRRCHASARPGLLQRPTSNGPTRSSRQKLSKRFLNRGTRLISDIGNFIRVDGRFRRSPHQRMVGRGLSIQSRRASIAEGVSEPAYRWKTECFAWASAIRPDCSPRWSIGLKAWIPKRNLVAVELEGAWAGAVSLPTSHTRSVVEQFAHANHIDSDLEAQRPTAGGADAGVSRRRTERDVVLQKVGNRRSRDSRSRRRAGRLPMSATDYSPAFHN